MAFNKGYKVFISPVAVGDDDLTVNAFAAIDDWVEMINVGTLPERGRTEGELTYPTLNNGVIKGKGSVNFGSGDFECSRKGTNAGRDEFVDAAETELNYAIKLLAPDGVDDSATPGDVLATREYLRCLVSGPVVPSGGDEQADIFRFPVMINQHEIVPSSVVPE